MRICSTALRSLHSRSAPTTCKLDVKKVLTSHLQRALRQGRDSSCGPQGPQWHLRVLLQRVRCAEQQQQRRRRRRRHPRFSPPAATFQLRRQPARATGLAGTQRVCQLSDSGGAATPRDCGHSASCVSTTRHLSLAYTSVSASKQVPGSTKGRYGAPANLAASRQRPSFGRCATALVPPFQSAGRSCKETCHGCSRHQRHAGIVCWSNSVALADAESDGPREHLCRAGVHLTRAGARRCA